MRNNKRSTILIALGVSFLLGAAAWTGFNLATAGQAGKDASQTMELLQVEIPRITAPQYGFVDTGSPEDNGEAGVEAELVSNVQEFPDHELNPDMEMPEKEVNGVRYIGYIEIPALGLELPVISQENAANLKKAPCRYTGSVYLDNLVIAGHNYIQHFGYIHKLSYGDVIRFVDADGNVFRYEVVDIESIPATGVEAMQQGDWDLTLFTCNLSKSSRITVRCVRTDK